MGGRFGRDLGLGLVMLLAGDAKRSERAAEAVVGEVSTDRVAAGRGGSEVS